MVSKRLDLGRTQCKTKQRMFVLMKKVGPKNEKVFVFIKTRAETANYKLLPSSNFKPLS